MDGPPRTKWEAMEDAKNHINKLILELESQKRTLENSMRDLEVLLEPTLGQLRDPLWYFKRVCDANELHFDPFKMRQCIIDHVTYDCGKDWLGCTLCDLVEKGSWEDLDLSDSYSRDEVMRLYKMKI